MEVEIKLNVDPNIPGGPSRLFANLVCITRLAGFGIGRVHRHDLRDLYFDTADARLANAGAGLRLRVEDGVQFVTVKVNRSQDGALTIREEFEEPLSQEALDRALEQVRDLVGPGPYPVLNFADGGACGGLIPVLDVRTKRVSRAIGDVALLVLDRVHYPSHSRTLFFDIEIERTGGTAVSSELRSLERALADLAGGYLRPAVSKLERGLHLMPTSR